jgi:16S rRNA processing protein RimM
MQLVIGKITGYHGVKGELKLYPLLDDHEELYNLKHLTINKKSYKIASLRPHKNVFLIKLAQIDSRNDAELLTGAVEAELDLKLAEGEYLVEDLKGLNACNANSKNLYGKVTNLITEVQPLLEIKLADSFNKKKSLLVPFVEDFISEVNVAEKQVLLSDAVEELIELNN